VTGSDEVFSCGRCEKVIGHFISHPKYPDLQLLNMGNGNLAESFHGHCAVCGAGIHFDWRWSLALRLFGADLELAGRDQPIT